MNFKLILAPALTTDVLLEAEAPLQGLNFIEEAAKCLRRNLDGQTNMSHTTLGTLSSYTISVPQAIAIESGKFNDQTEFTLYLPNNFLNEYIFYGAAVSSVNSKRSCYPFYSNSVVLVSYIDELAVINTWKNAGYMPRILEDGTGADFVAGGNGGCCCGNADSGPARNGQYALSPFTVG